MNAILLFITLVAAPFALGQISQPEIIVDQADSHIFPAVWRNSKTAPSAVPLSGPDQPQARALVEEALSHYPAEVLSTSLKKVYVVAALKYRGVSTGGTNSRSIVYVVSHPKYTAAQIERIFHAEYSSILFRNHHSQFDLIAWQAINPPGFAYRGSGVAAIKNKQASVRIKEDVHTDGFLHEYGLASIEEDFNSYAALLFMGDRALWSAIETHPKVKAKADLVIAFYHKIHPTFTLAYFHALRPASATP
ncbi:hypothetical protein EI77_03376 [Prosthecobacter fusiformis]|uniref:Uncharacterized protein n=1 Tax=Prosthecobacter fusiformis TaxID=48464 RepID=A0A4R7RQV9_9BACT|nr:hypothetical protein [Prosthecobacter fusiformis]TDU67175.1 hypothetical protein EI77_03376 [Prosthecobacter fusiformis]